MNADFYISNFQILDPPYWKSQEQTFSWLEKAYSQSEYTSENFQKLLRRVACAPEQISKRAHYLDDFNKTPDTKIFHSDRKSENVNHRMRFFDSSMTDLMENTYRDRPVPQQLIHVSCTGYVSPSPAQKAVKQMQDSPTVTHCYHMGCYASIPALRIACGFVATNTEDRCDIFHTELCTLHFQTESLQPEQLVIQSLFADGTAVYSLSNQKTESPALKVLFLGEKIIPSTDDLMSWAIAEGGFAMTLSRSVPVAIAGFLRSNLKNWTSTWTKDFDFSEDLIWAVHPGGPKIIDQVKEVFELSENQVRHSRKVLFERGNMSSATLPHIWNEILSDDSVESGARVLSLAFGPGLTVAASLMQVMK